MPKLVNIKGYGQVSFPDEMDDDAIAHSIETELVPQMDATRKASLSVPAAAPSPPTQPSNSTFMSKVDALLKPYASKLEAINEAVSKPLLTEAELNAPDGDLASGLSEGLGALVPRTGKDLAMLGGIVAVSAVNPLAGAGLAAGLVAKHAGEKAGELSVAVQQGDVKGIAKESVQLAADALMLKGTMPNVGKGLAAVDAALNTKRVVGDVAKELSKDQVPLPAAGQVIESTPATSETSPAPATTQTATPATRFTDPPGLDPSFSSLGPTPTPAGFAVAGAKAVNTAWRGIAEQVQMMDTKAQVAAGSDAIDTLSANYAKQVGNDARFEIIGRSTPRNDTLPGLLMNMFTESERLDLQAMTPIVEAGTELGRLQAMAHKVINSPNVEASYKRIYDHALVNFSRLGPKAARIVQAFDDQIAAERAAGMDVDYAQNYVTHRYDFDLMLGPNKPVVLDSTGGRGFGGSTFFKKNRVFESYADAIEAGYRPKTLDIADLLEHRVRAGQRNINSRAWIDGMRGIDSPVTSTPLVTDMLTQPSGTKVPPLGYSTWSPVPGMTVALNETIKPLVDALTSENGLPSIITKPVAIWKHGLLAVDTFHAARMIYRAAGLNQAGYKKGLSLVEYSDAGLNEAVKAGEINQTTADWARANRPLIELGQQQGLNVGKISDALHKDVMAKVPGIGPFTKFVFDKLTRGLMAQSYVWAFKRNSALHPGLEVEAVARKTASEINTYYGNLMNQGLLKSKKMQDMARIAFLAPQWVEAMARTDLGAGLQAAKVPLELAKGNGLKVGTLARGVGAATVGFLALNQLINHFTQGGFTWDTNPDGHKMDAYIPDWVEGSKGYWLSPMATSMELTHDMVKYMGGEDKGALQAVGKLMGNKAGLGSRIVSDLLVGQTIGDPSKPLVDTSDRLKEAASEMNPLPLTARMFQDSYLGSKERQIAGSMGLKLERFKTPQEEKRAAKGRAYQRYEDVVDAALIDIRRHPDQRNDVLQDAKGKLDPKQWPKARVEITRRSRKKP